MPASSVGGHQPHASIERPERGRSGCTWAVSEIILMFETGRTDGATDCPAGDVLRVTRWRADGLDMSVCVQYISRINFRCFFKRLEGGCQKVDSDLRFRWAGWCKPGPLGAWTSLS